MTTVRNSQRGTRTAFKSLPRWRVRGATLLGCVILSFQCPAHFAARLAAQQSGDGTGAAVAEQAAEPEYQREDFVSDASFIAYSYEPKIYQRDAAPSAAELASAQVAAAQAFLATLEGDPLARAHHALRSPERRAWTNLPARPDAGGLRFGDMNATQTRAACELLATLLSQSGYRKMLEIMVADDQLLQGGRPRAGFGTEEFAVVIFGEPKEGEPWGLQLDGHHVGLNISVAGERLTCSPSFVGTQPEKFKLGEGQKEVQPMSGEIRDAYALLDSLTEQQQATAVLAERRGDLRAGPGQDGNIPDAEGIAAAEMNEHQRELLQRLISNWVHLMPPAQAEQRMQEIAAELDSVQFGWRGSTEFGGDFSFAIQGPSLLIEHSCQQRGNNPRNHMHSIFRHPQNEYGGQLEK